MMKIFSILHKYIKCGYCSIQYSILYLHCALFFPQNSLPFQNSVDLNSVDPDQLTSDQLHMVNPY